MFKLTKIVGFAPDLPATTPGILVACNNIFPTVRGIGSPPTFVALSSGTLDSSTVVGAAQVAQADGTLKRYIGTGAKLWESDGSTALTDRSGTAYSASITQGWSFCSFGDVVLAANKGNTIQKANAGSFSDLSGAPKAAIVLNVGPPSSPFIMALNYDDGTNTPDGWFCSGISDYTTWNSTAAQSVNGRLLEPTGPFTAAVPFRDGLIAWKQNAMYLGTYVGSPVVWQWNRIASDIGCCGKNMAVVAGDVAYFADKRGFWFFDGSYPKPIPGYVHDYWSGIIARGGTINDTNQMRWDPVNHNIWISYQLSSQVFSWLFWNSISGIWAGSVDVMAIGATTGIVKNLVAMEPKLLVTTGDSNVALGTFGGNSGGTNGRQPNLITWYEGDPVSYVAVDQVRPYFTNTATGFTAAGGAASSSSTCFLITNTDSALTTSVSGSSVALSSQLTFDLRASANFIAADMMLLGAWQMSHIGMSVNGAGAKAKP